MEKNSNNSNSNNNLNNYNGSKKCKIWGMKITDVEKFIDY